jgi:mRNA-degrading endonuclease RelE of RelBE toxin-antitoxin system
MSINSNNVEVNLTPQFRKDLKNLAKRYRSIRKDLQPLIEELQSGNTPGDRLEGLSYQVFKVRLKNSDIQKGKSAGYRVIYYLQTQTGVVLVTIYLFQIRSLRPQQSNYRASYSPIRIK